LVCNVVNGNKEMIMSEAVNPKLSDDSDGMDYLSSLPQRLVRVYLPLLLIVIVLLFPFYWMGITSIKPKDQLLDLDSFNPLWVWKPTFEHIYALLFETDYPTWLWNTMFVAVAATILSLIASVFSAYAITRIRFKGANTVGGMIFLAYLVPPSILFIPLSTVVFQYGLFDTPFALAAHGLFQNHSLRAGGMRAHRWRHPLANSHQDHPAAGCARPDLCIHFLSDAVLE
jgi:multiple sugar transport system permease protein